MNNTHMAGSSSSDLQPSVQMVDQVAPCVNQSDQVQEIPPVLPKSAEKSTQAYIAKKYRSKGSHTYIRIRNSVTSPLEVEKVNNSVSPSKNIAVSKSARELTLIEEDASASEISIAPSVPDFSPSLKSVNLRSSSSSNEKIKAGEEYKKQLNLQSTLTKIKNKPLLYIGLQKSCYFLINIIEKHSGIPEKFILLCLKKIRLNTEFEELADEFGITKSYASKIFMKNMPILAQLLSPFHVKLDRKLIKLHLPIAFRYKYYNVLCIIDCVEIEIEKPSKATHQALTWSHYKKSNTVKYLISYTPNGLVNYISPGFGGKITDTELVEYCNFLDSLPPATEILAVRGFKHLEPLLVSEGFNLVRPPKTKETASLRIHVERVIRRLREFTFFKPHVINKKLLNNLDEAITIAGALINLQDSISKN